MNLQEAICIFNIQKFYTLEELKKQYYTLAKLNHPDLSNTTEERIKKEECMQKINAAYDLLKSLKEVDYLKFLKKNIKKELYSFLSDLTVFEYSKSLKIQEIFLQNNFSNEEITEFLYRFINKRIKYYYNSKSTYLFTYHFDKNILSKEELFSIKLLCEGVKKEHIAAILLELDSVIEATVSKRLNKQLECLTEYYRLSFYNYTKAQKKYLMEILKSNLSVKERKVLFLKYSVYFQLETFMDDYVKSVLYLFNDDQRTHARKQVLLNTVNNFIGNLIDQKVDKKEFISSKKNNFSFSILFSSFLKKKTEFFILEVKKICEDNKIFFTNEEIKKYNEVLYQKMFEASHEKTIEPPRYVLRKKISI